MTADRLFDSLKNTLHWLKCESHYFFTQSLGVNAAVSIEHIYKIISRKTEKPKQKIPNFTWINHISSR